MGTVEPAVGEGPAVTQWHWPDVINSELNIIDEDSDVLATVEENSSDPVRLPANQRIQMEVESNEENSSEGDVGVCVIGAASPCNGK